MDSAIGFLFTMVVLAGVGFGFAILYKNRIPVTKWLNAPYYAEDDRKLRLQRRIEDAQKELEAIEQREQIEATKEE